MLLQIVKSSILYGVRCAIGCMSWHICESNVLGRAIVMVLESFYKNTLNGGTTL